jgi:hypothetical protein
LKCTPPHKNTQNSDAFEVKQARKRYTLSSDLQTQRILHRQTTLRKMASAADMAGRMMQNPKGVGGGLG